MSRLLTQSRGLAVALLDGLVLLLHPARSQRNRILIIRLDAIGDFVLWLDAAEALVRFYRTQGSSVVLLGNKIWATWAKGLLDADEVWEIDVPRFKGRLAYRWQWLIRIRKAGFRIAILPAYSRKFLEGDSLVRASGAPERIGSEGDTSNIGNWAKSWSNRWFTRLVAAEPQQMMELGRNAEFVRGLGLKDYQPRLPRIPAASGAFGNLPHQPYAVLCCSAGWEGREWPLDNFIEIGRRLMERGLLIVLTGGAADRPRAEEFIKALSAGGIDLTGMTELAELAEVLRGADVVVTNESSAMHIGPAVDAPVVCILGGGHFGRFAPYESGAKELNRILPIVLTEPMPCFGCNWACRFPRKKDEAVKCIQDISVGKVWQAVEAALARHRHVGAPDTFISTA